MEEGSGEEGGTIWMRPLCVGVIYLHYIFAVPCVMYLRFFQCCLIEGPRSHHLPNMSQQVNSNLAK